MRWDGLDDDGRPLPPGLRSAIRDGRQVSVVPSDCGVRARRGAGLCQRGDLDSSRVYAAACQGSPNQSHSRSPSVGT